MSRNKWWTGATPIAVLSVAAMVLAGCGSSSEKGSSSAESVDRSATLRIADPVANTLDLRASTSGAITMISTWPVYDRLIQVGADDSYEPMLASDWEFSDDGRSLTMSLRQGVTFTDGTPFDARAVKKNMAYFEGAESGPLHDNMEVISGVTVLDSHQVRFDLARPSTEVLATLSDVLGGAMISPKAIQRGDLAEHPVGTGAYVMDSFTPGQEITYERRTDENGIWDSGTGKPAAIVIRSMAGDAIANSLKSNQIDIGVWSSKPTPFESGIASGDLKFVRMKGVLNMMGVHFNTTRPPFDDADVRRAVNYAIDRESIVEAFTPNDVITRPWPEGMLGSDQIQEDGYSYDPAKARELLEQAGYADGLDAGDMLVATAGARQQVAEAIQANLKEVGIEVELKAMDSFQQISAWAKSEANSQVMIISNPIPDPLVTLRRIFTNPVWVPGGGSKQIHSLIVPEIDDPTVPDTRRAELIAGVIEHAMSEALYVPLWQGSGGFVATARVGGTDDLKWTAQGVADLRYVYLRG